MNQCKKCGATLPDNARFCLQCGAEVVHTVGPPVPGQPEKELDFLRPALAGGMALGLLSSLPFVGALCCVWVPAGGFLAAYLLNKQRPGAVTYGDGAFGGVISGLFGAIVATIVSIPVRMMNTEALEQARAQMEEAFRTMPPAARRLFEFLLSGEITAASVLFWFISYALIFGLLAMIGGIVGAAILNRKKTD